MDLKYLGVFQAHTITTFASKRENEFSLFRFINLKNMKVLSSSLTLFLSLLFFPPNFPQLILSAKIHLYISKTSKFPTYTFFDNGMPDDTQISDVMRPK